MLFLFSAFLVFFILFLFLCKIRNFCLYFVSLLLKDLEGIDAWLQSDYEDELDRLREDPTHEIEPITDIGNLLQLVTSCS